MPYRDLSDYVGELDRRGLLQVVDEKICKDTELVPLVRLQFRGLPENARKAFWFRNVTDARGREFDGSVVLGALGSSRAIYAAALAVEPDGTRHWYYGELRSWPMGLNAARLGTLFGGPVLLCALWGRWPGRRALQALMVSAYQNGLPPSTTSGSGRCPCLR